MIIYGRNAVSEAFRASRPVDVLYVLKGVKGLNALVSAAKGAGAVVKEANADKFNALLKNEKEPRHGGVICVVSRVRYSSVGEILSVSETKREPPFIIIADGIEDPRNLGALIRSAEAAGADGIIIPKRGGAPVTGAVYAASAGAAAFLKTARVTNLTDTVKELKKRGVWVYGAEADGEPYYDADFSGGVCLVVGSEGRGLGRLVRENCDFIVSVPLRGRVGSLNASVCGGILMFHIAKIRDGGAGASVAEKRVK